MTTPEQQIRAIQTQGVFPFGKYFGQSITDIMVSDPGYIEWIKGGANGYSKVLVALINEIETRPLRELQAYKKACRELLRIPMNDKIKNYVNEEMDK